MEEIGPGTAEIDPHHLDQWVSYGIAKIDQYLGAHAAFDQYIKEHDEQRSQESNPDVPGGGRPRPPRRRKRS